MNNSTAFPDDDTTGPATRMSTDEISTKEDERSLKVPDRLKFEIPGVEKKEEDEEVTDRFRDFENWLLKNGAEFSDLYLKRYTGDVRGVHAKRDIGSYKCVLSIPAACLITDHMGRTETELGRTLFEGNSSANLSTPNLIAVIVYILTTREDPDHFFQPYYKILPKDYTNFPIFWDDEKLAWLEGSPLIDDIMERKHNMRSDYEEVCRICPEFKRFSFEEFLEVRTAVGSRNFGIVVNGEKRTAMVPYADMLNHYRPRETSWTFENSKNAFTISSICNLRAGQQVMDSYGKKCNSKFFLHYGFAVECNREEDGRCQNELLFRFSLRAAVDDPLRETRLAFLGPSRATRGFRVSMNIEDKATAEALSFLRVKVASEKELNEIIARNAVPVQRSSRNSQRDPSVPFLNRMNEAAALEKMAQACLRQLHRYPKTTEENKAMLESGNVPAFTDRRTALVVILGEQEICHFWINAANVLCPLLRSKSGHDLRVALLTLPESDDAERDLARYGVYLADELRRSASFH